MIIVLLCPDVRASLVIVSLFCSFLFYVVVDVEVLAVLGYG